MNRLDFEALQKWETEQQQIDDDLDDDLDAGPEPMAIQPQALLMAIMLVIVPTTQGSVNWPASFRRLAALAALVLPEVGKDPLTAIANQLTRAGLPTTKAALSVLNVKLADLTGFRRTEKTLAAREIYRQSALRFWGKKNR